MQTEFELKILEIDVDEVASKLDLLGARKISEKMQKRLVYDFNPKKENSWIRLRTDGSKTTLAIKKIQNDRIDGTKELEVAVESFEKMSLILEKLGYTAKGYQENKRITYVLDDVEIDIDFWPRIPAYLEIEGKSVSEVKKIVKKLGYDLSRTTSINAFDVYERYGIDLNSIRDLKFESE